MLRIGALDVPDGAFVLMAIVNRTPDSFYDRGATYAWLRPSSGSTGWSPTARTWSTSAA